MNANLSTDATTQTAPDADAGDEPGSPAESDPDEPAPRVTVSSDAEGVDCAWLETRLGSAIDQLPRPAGGVSIVLVEDAEMTRLHLEHLGEGETTDVLTFDLSESDDPSAPFDCEIYVCVDEARRRAAERCWAAERELLLYALHGMLHCCGHDDRTDAGFTRMHAEEDRILAAIGIGATFVAEDRP